MNSAETTPALETDARRAVHGTVPPLVVPFQRRDQDAVACYHRFVGKAIKYRDASRDETEPQSVRIMRREMMRFYARLAVTTCGGCRGSIFV
jgi:hypothetical protein